MTDNTARMGHNGLSTSFNDGDVSLIFCYHFFITPL